jgi:hypothetical protein
MGLEYFSNGRGRGKNKGVGNALKESHLARRWSYREVINDKGRGNIPQNASQQPSSFLSPVPMVRQTLQGLPFMGPDARLLLYLDLPG